MDDFRQYYNIETYLFDTVRPRFIQQGYLEAFDFFCIVIWKANRAKSRIAKKLLVQGHENLDAAVRVVTGSIHQQRTAKDRLRVLWDWGFYLPMASAILTVLYPDEFTIYDVRVCEALGDFHDLKNISNFDKLWIRYEMFTRSVEAAVPQNQSLRDKDRSLLGKLFSEQLTKEITSNFSKEHSNTHASD